MRAVTGPLRMRLVRQIAPSGAFCKSLDADGQGSLREAYRRRLGVGDGPFELSARAWAVVGTVS